jgi:hypothetical protein
MDRKEVTDIADKIAKKEVKGHEMRMHPGGKRFAKGGKTGEMMKAVGRNLAKVANQTGKGG